MQKELNLLLPLISDASEITINDITFHTGTIGAHSIIAMQSGIGKVNAAIGTMTLIDNFHPSLVINTGVAGGAGGAANILDIVIGDRIAYHDVWCGPGTEWGDAAGCPRFFRSADAITSLEVLHNNDTIRHGLIASGDIFVSRPEEVERIRSIYPDVLAVDMESAAIAQVCYIKGVPFLAMRVISDTPGADDNIAQYENFWEDAPRSTFQTLKALLAEIDSTDERS